MKYKLHFYIRKTHRYLGIFIGIQFLLWTVGGLYFSWTDIDQIHGDQFRTATPPLSTISLELLKDLPDSSLEAHSLETRQISGEQFLWINNDKLINAKTGLEKKGISKEEAIGIAKQHIVPGQIIETIEYISHVGPHDEYRGQALPAWKITYEGDDRLRAYISAQDGKLQRLRYDSWRIFDFLWMLHIMDYNSRDDINNWILRAFSALGIFTICSGFFLYLFSSGTIKKLSK